MYCQNWVNKRLFKINLLVLCFIGIISCKKNAEQITRPSSPNFLVIIADDAGWNDVGYNGSEIGTPNIDLLAKNGVQLNRFYAYPTCSPSRAAFLTGRPASRMGILAPISGKSEKSLPDTISTLPQQLKLLNYETALFGKWHLGLQPSSGPKAYGFDYSYGFLHGQIDQYTHEYKNGDASWYRNDAFVTEEGHATDLIENETVQWLTEKRDHSKNFYIQLAYSAPHFPLQEEDRWEAPYMNTISNGSRRDFAAAMSHLDHSIGNVLATLKEQQLEENTIVIFISDNGAMENWYPKTQYEGRHGPNSVLGSNVPLRDWKTSNYEGSIRVPGIIYWKKHLNAFKNDAYISVIDLMPSLLSLAGARSIPETVEGKNIWNSIIAKDSVSTNEIYIRGHLQESIIQKPWKLIRTRHKNKEADFELYNIENDPEEKRNEIINKEEITNRLKSILRTHFKKDAKEVNVGLR